MLILREKKALLIGPADRARKLPGADMPDHAQHSLGDALGFHDGSSSLA
ncbi:hypothetical protein RGQ15_21035 [Paracoccus sp. MBLB3053]|uniref:Uncharacterized protein n=1 Tax=Paracoccus aurantius TaxID=3073814 RepID=A0ABU2HZS4_9RHOB|nr:hypothetical protein [Paracoccus sp. MBLB3053]MDS9470040.1 hypothetical protein [Paracoccus sp. MBLB3053]